MTKDEALKLALETLEISLVFVMSHEMIKQPEGADWYDNRITAIKEALAQPEQGPVAWEQFHEHMAGSFYTHPPQRPWVGLTHKEMYDAIRPLCSADEMATWLLEISEDEYLAIEAKLKEKNT